MDYIQLIAQSKLLRVTSIVAISYLFFQVIDKFYTIFWRLQYFRSFPQSKSDFFYGHAKHLLSSVGDFVCNINANFPVESVFAVWFGWHPVIFCLDYRSAEAVLSKPNHRKGDGYTLIGLKDGLVVSHGAKWKARRRMIEPFFTTKSLSTYTPVMNESCNKMTKDIHDKKIKSIDMDNYIYKTSFDIILETTMTVPIEFEQPLKERMLEGINQSKRILRDRVTNPVMWNDWLFYRTEIGKYFKASAQLMDGFMEPRITQKLDRKASIEPEREKRKDFIDLLLNHYDENTTDVSTIDMDGIKEETLNLIIAGHDTIAAGLRWTLFLLGNNLDCQEKLYDEIANSVRENQDLTNLGNINGLTYLDQCIKEAMRLFPPIPLISRELDFDAVVGKRVIPRGSDIVFSYYNIHRDSNVWDNPDAYDPDRFSPERFSKIPKYAYLPFGLGKRVCIGQRFAMIEMKLFLIHLMRSYSFVSTQSVDQVKLDMDVTIKPKTPLTIKLTPRS